MAGTPPIDLVKETWGRRLTELAQAGVPLKKLAHAAPIVQEDIRNVKSGSQAMPNDAALLSIASAIKGRPVLQKQEDSGWNPSDLWGDVTKDLGDLTWRAVPGLARFAWESPQHLQQTADVMSKGTSAADTRWLKKHGYEHNDPITPESLFDPSVWARQIRNVSKTPILGIIPGIHTAAGLTTEKGRGELAHHPLSTAVDVAIPAQMVSRMAGLAAKAGVAEGSVAEAAIQAHPLKALYRTLPEGVRATIGEKTLSGLRKAGFDPQSFDLSRRMDHEVRRAKQAWDAEVKAAGGDVVREISKLPEEERLLLHEEATRPDLHPNPSPEHIAIIEHVRGVNTTLEKLGGDNLVRIPGPEQVAPSPTAEWLQTHSTESMTPSDQAGFNEQGVAPNSGPPDAAQLAAEEAALAEHAKNAPETFVRESDKTPEQRVAERRAAERRVANGESPAGVDRRTAERAPRNFDEARRVDQAGGDRRVLAQDDAAFRAMTPEQQAAIRQSESTIPPPTPQDLARAAVAEAAGNTELAAALRQTHTEADIQGGLLGQETAAEAEARLANKDTGTRAQVEADTGKSYVYSAKSEVARTHRAAVEAETKLAELKMEGEAIREKARVKHQRALGKKEAAVTRARNRLDAAQVKLKQKSVLSQAGKGSARAVDAAAVSHNAAVDNMVLRQTEFERLRDNPEPPSDSAVAAHERKLAKAERKVEQTRATFKEKFKQQPPASFRPMMEARVRDRIQGDYEATNRVVENQDPVEGAALAVKQMERVDLHNLLTTEEYNAIHEEIMATWQDVAAEGFDPVWTHNVDVMEAGHAPYTKVLPDRNARLTQIKDAAWDMKPHVTDLAVSMSHALHEYIVHRSTAAFLNENMVPRSTNWSEIRHFIADEADLMRAQGKIPRGVDAQGAMELALRKHFVEWTPDDMVAHRPPDMTAQATIGDEKVYLPKNIAKIANDITEPYRPNAFVKAAATSTKIYKTSIMAFSLKHMMHILLGGSMMLAGRGGWAEITNFKNAWKMVKEGEMPIELNRHLDIDTPDQMHQVAVGNKLGQLYMDSLGRVSKLKWRFDETVSNIQRSMAMLGEESRALKRGASPAEARMAGLEHSYKTLVDIDGMNPMERNVIRQVVPFYAFMRHTLKYVMTYPFDHPMRAAILSRITSIEQKDWNSGLPEAMQSLFFMGTPDAKGDITGVEMRQFNPFRDTGTYFTLAGFIKALNPALQIPFTIAGVDKFTGAPELYPEISYDPKTGSLVAKRPPNSPWNAALTYVPELGIVDHFAGITNDMRKMKARDPEAYKKQLWNMLFVPFEPKTVNMNIEAADMQRNILRVAQQAVSKATQSGNTANIKDYNMVPYQGELVTPQTLTNVIDLIQKIRPGVAPKSVLPPTKLSKLAQ